MWPVSIISSSNCSLFPMRECGSPVHSQPGGKVDVLPGFRQDSASSVRYVPCAMKKTKGELVVILQRESRNGDTIFAFSFVVIISRRAIVLLRRCWLNLSRQSSTLEVSLINRNCNINSCFELRSPRVTSRKSSLERYAHKIQWKRTECRI